MEPAVELPGVVAPPSRCTSVEPRYWPTFDLATGRIVGADVVAPVGLAGASSSPAWGSSLPVTALVAARAFTSGTPAQQGWWMGASLRRGQLLARSTPDLIAGLLAHSGLEPERFVVHTTEAELAALGAGGAAGRLGELGIGLSIVDLGAGALAPASLLRVLDQVRIESIRVDVSALDPAAPLDVDLLAATCEVASQLGVDVIGLGVETDDHLDLVSRAGVGLVQGFRWGSAGPVSKLVDTWARPVARPGAAEVES